MVSFFKKNNPSLKIQAFWNALAGLLCALEAVVMTIVASRFLDLKDTGELTIAFAFGNLFRTIGLCRIRNYQLSDLKFEFSFNDYRGARLVSMFLMLTVIIGNVIFVSFSSFEKAVVVFIIEIIYFIECFEDLIAGEYQRRGRLDIGAKLFLLRWGSFLSSYVIFVYLLRSLVISMLISLLISTIIFLLMLKFGFGFPDINVESKECILNKRQKELLKKTFPLFIITFLTFFLSNVAKYSLDYFFDEDAQAIFGFVSLSLFAVEMLSGFLYQPRLTTISRFWVEKNYEKYFFEISRQFFIIFLIILICFLGGWLIGIPVLSLLFSTELSPYKIDLMLNILAGGFLAFATFESALLTIMRKQKLQLLIFFLTAIFGGLFMFIVVRRYSIRGASWGNFIVFFVQAIALGLSMIFVLFKNKRFL